MKLLVAAAFVYLSSFLNVPSMAQRENSEYWISVIEIILIHYHSGAPLAFEGHNFFSSEVSLVSLKSLSVCPQLLLVCL